MDPPKTPGPKGPSQALIDAVIEMKRRNPRYGYRRMDQFTRRIIGFAAWIFVVYLIVLLPNSPYQTI